MNKKFLVIPLAAAMLMTASCQNASKESAPEIPAKSVSDEIIANSVTNVQGNTLYMEFNNTAGTATFTLGTDTILLKQDTMASGIRFSNEHYLYAEHQGEIRLTKDSEVVFEHKN